MANTIKVTLIEDPPPIRCFVGERNRWLARVLPEVLGDLECPEYRLLQDSIPYDQTVGNWSKKSFYGSILRDPILATKAIMHPLIPHPTRRPHFWNQDFATQLLRDQLTLPGYSVFSEIDLRIGVELLFTSGITHIRIKPTMATSGDRQIVISNMADLDLLFETHFFEKNELNTSGCVIEENLVGDIQTYSWGISLFGNHTLYYLGNQRTTLITKCGASEKIHFYAGTDILGWFGDKEKKIDTATLETIQIRSGTNIGEIQKMGVKFLHFFTSTFNGDALVSRFNLDIIAGVNTQGKKIIRIIEQSFRVGGASPAEFVAVKALIGKNKHKIISTSSYLQLNNLELPEGSTEISRGNDIELGPYKIGCKIHQIFDT